MPDYALYEVRILTCSPLHIGSGETLMRDYDYVVHGSRTWRLNLDALLAEKAEDPAVAARLATVAPGALLQPQDFDPASPLFRYVIDGAPRSPQAGAPVREQIKDVWDRPYLPGSSLKGALRTALVWHGVAAGQRGVNLDQLGKSSQWAAQPLEREILGRDPNHDLLRALQIADSEPLGSESLRLLNARVVTRDLATASPIEVEAIKTNTHLRARLKIDRALFGAWARERGLELGGALAWLEELPAIVQRFSQQRLQPALAWCGARPATARIGEFYRNLQREKPGNVCYLQLGWGAGWDSKTLGALLQADPARFEALVRAHRLSRSRRRQAGDPFPATRRMSMRVADDGRGRRVETLGAPLGWVRLTFERRL